MHSGKEMKLLLLREHSEGVPMSQTVSPSQKEKQESAGTKERENMPVIPERKAKAFKKGFK